MLTLLDPQIGQLANLYCRKTLPLQVMQSSAGFYIGTCDDPDGHPNSPAYGHLKLPHLN